METGECKVSCFDASGEEVEVFEENVIPRSDENARFAQRAFTLVRGAHLLIQVKNTAFSDKYQLQRDVILPFSFPAYFDPQKANIIVFPE